MLGAFSQLTVSCLGTNEVCLFCYSVVAIDALRYLNMMQRFDRSSIADSGFKVTSSQLLEFGYPSVASNG